MAADMLLDGNVKVSWVPTIASLAAPTAAEMTAGTSLEQRLTPDGLDISFDTDMIDNSALGSSYNTEAVGRSKVSISLKYKAQAVGSSDPVATALVYQAVGFLVVRRGTPATTDFAAAQKVEVYPAQVGRPNPDTVAPNAIQTVTVRMGSTADPRGWDNPGHGRRLTVDISEVLKRAKPPERFVDVCLNANLKAEHADLDQQMQDVAAAIEAGEGNEERRRALADQLHELEGRMRAETVRFHLRGMSAYQRDEWLDAHPRREGKQEAWNPVTGEPALLAACCVDPSMSAEQATELRKTLGGDWDRLVAAAWEASTEASSVPFSLLASVARRQPSGK